jgi:hypothetical protein
MSRFSEYTPTELYRRQKISKEYYRDLENLENQYPQSKATTPVVESNLWQGFLNFVSEFNFFTTLSRAKFVERKHALTMQYAKQIEQFEREHSVKRASEEQEALQTAPGLSPFEIKQLVLSHGGEVIHIERPLSVNLPGNISKQSYGFEKNWVMNATRFSTQNLPSDEMIDALESFEIDVQKETDQLAREGDLGRINPTIDKLSQEEISDKEKQGFGATSKKALGKDFAHELIAQLNQRTPRSLLINLSSSEGKTYTLSVLKDNNGIWFHDHQYGCFYFPQSSQNDASVDFPDFVQRFREKNYAQFKEVALIEIEQKTTLDNKPDNTPTPSATLSRKWLPGLSFQKQQPKPSVEPEEPKTDKPSPHSPNKPKNK